MEELESIGGRAYFSDSKIKSLGKLKRIGISADFADSAVEDLGELESIGGDADFRGSKITDLGNLKEIGGYADFANSKITKIENLKVGGRVIFTDKAQLEAMKIKNLSIKRGGYVDLGNDSMAFGINSAELEKLGITEDDANSFAQGAASDEFDGNKKMRDVDLSNSRKLQGKRLKNI